MVDNVTADAGTGGAVFATDDIGGVHYPITKLTFGALDSQTIASSGNGTVDAGTLRVTVASDTTGVLSVDDNAGSLTIDNADITTIAGAVSGTEMQVDIVAITPDLMLGTDFSNVLGTTSLVTTATLADTVATTQDVLNVRSFNYVYNGTTFDFVREGATAGSILVDGSNETQPVSNAGLTALDGAITGTEVQVDLVSADVTNAGTFAVQADLGANNDVTVTGPNAHDGTTLGNPVLGAARATNSVEGITQVANADLTHIQADLNGVLLTRNGTTLEEIVSERVTNTNGTSTNMTGAFAAGGANIHAYVTSVTIHNAHATTMGFVDLRDGSAGSVVWTFPAPATGGSTHNFDPPLKFAANTAVAYDVSAAITTVYISINGFFAAG